jgi:hypothetical protein
MGQFPGYFYVPANLCMYRYAIESTYEGFLTSPCSSSSFIFVLGSFASLSSREQQHVYRISLDIQIEDSLPVTLPASKG